jgi:cell division protein FtsW (lipid II flippase)
MGANPVANQPLAKKVGRLLKRLAQVLITVAALAAMLFLSSWRFDWVMAWVYVGTFALALTAMTVYQELSNPNWWRNAPNSRRGKGCRPGT